MDNNVIYLDNCFIIDFNQSDIMNVAIISVSKKGGHIVLVNSTKNVDVEIISQEEANSIGQKFLETRGISNMKPTYFIKQNGIVTINYAYTQSGVVVYSDLIKLKVALDDGEILGMETSGYLNSHTHHFSPHTISLIHLLLL